jgi:cytoskeletal protein RodZ
MTIEGLGKKFQEARVARNLTLDEAARMTKIRPHRLAEIREGFPAYLREIPGCRCDALPGCL